MPTPPTDAGRTGSAGDDRLHLADVARHLGVTRQRVHQLAAQPGFPASDESPDGLRRWDRAALHEWADREWWGSKPWRS